MTGTLRNTIAVAIAGLLAAYPVTGLSADGRLLPGVGLAIVVLQLVAGLVRRFSGNPWLANLAQLGVLLAALPLAARWAVPDPAGEGRFARLGEVWEQGLRQMAEQTAPMSPDASTLVLLVAVAGLITIAIDASFIALRSVGIAVAPMLGGYLTAAAVLDDPVSIGSVVAVCVGWLVLLASRTVDHENRWPRGLIKRTGSRLSVRGFGTIALAVGVPAITLAILAGMLVPNTGRELWPDSGDGGSVQLTDPSIQLNENLKRPEDRPVLQYTTTAPDGVLLRTSALTRVDADGWHQVNMALQRGFPTRVPGLPSVDWTNRTDVSVMEFQSNYLPAPYAPVDWQIEGTWNFDPLTLTVLNVDQPSQAADLAGVSYSVMSVDAEPTVERLVNSAAGTPPEGTLASEVPADMPQIIAELASEITTQAPTAGLKAIALQDWLRDPSRFTYDLNAPSGTGYGPLVNFLTTDNRGYCVHFSAAMALMARTVGIPSRVAIGFTPGTQQDDGSWVVTSHNMHAWPELYFSGLGWVRFEPTVSVGSEPEWTEIPEPDAEPTPTPTPTPTTDPGQEQPLPEPTLEPDQPGVDPDAPGVLDLRWLLGALGVIAVLLLPAAARGLLRWRRLSGRDPSGRVRGAWRELEASAIDLGLEWPDATPRQIGAASWPGLDADGRAALRRLALLTERMYYSPGLPADVEVASDVRLVTSQWQAVAPTWRRIWTRLVPRSLTMDLAARAEHSIS